MSGDTWRIAAASAIGTSHLRGGTPCQDAHRCDITADRDGQLVLVAVASDGAGSAARAEVGAAVACMAFLGAVRLFLAHRQLHGVGEADARGWFAAVREAVTTRAREEQRDARDYNCTFLAAVIGMNDAVFLQLGDGAIVARDPEGSWCWVHWPQHGEFANTTYFVPEVESQTRLMVEVARRRVDEVSMFTDGLEPLLLHYASRSVQTSFFDSMFPPVRGSAHNGVDPDLSAGLERYLGLPAVCDRTDDDKTLILASRLNPGNAGTAAA